LLIFFIPMFQLLAVIQSLKVWTRKTKKVKVKRRLCFWLFFLFIDHFQILKNKNKKFEEKKKRKKKEKKK